MARTLLVILSGFGLAMALMASLVTRGPVLWITAVGGAIALFVLWWLLERSKQKRRAER